MLGDRAEGRHLRGGGQLRHAVVLAHEDHRQRPHGGQVQRFVERAVRGASVAEERHRNLPRAPLCRRQRRAEGDGHPGADDPVCADDAEAGVGDVHRAALAFAVAVALAEQLGHAAVHPPVLGEHVAVASMGRGDVVVDRQSRAHAGGDGLLADVDVHCAGQFPRCFEGRDPLLEETDPHHAPVEVDEASALGGRRTPRRGAHSDPCAGRARRPAAFSALMRSRPGRSGRRRPG